MLAASPTGQKVENMEEEQINHLLTQIAGKNALGVNDPTIQRLCHCVNYLVIQHRIRASIDDKYEMEQFAGIGKQVISILEGE